MKSKKFKTVAGYLRHADDQILAKAYRTESQDWEQTVAVVQAEQRTVLNNLLPQLGLQCIEAVEKPIDGVERLMKAGGTEQQ